MERGKEQKNSDATTVLPSKSSSSSSSSPASNSGGGGQILDEKNSSTADDPLVAAAPDGGTPPPALDLGEMTNKTVLDKFYFEDVWKPRARYGTWKNRLYTPTYVTQQMGFWFIVDCWHHRVLYRRRGADEKDDELDKVPISEWRSMPVHDDAALVIPHSVASDGNVVVTESSIGGSKVSADHSILVWEPKLKTDSRSAAKMTTPPVVTSPSPASTTHPASTTASSAPSSPPSNNSNNSESKSNSSNSSSNSHLMIDSTAAVLAENEDWRLIQILRVCDRPGIAARPHRILYDSVVSAFFLYSTHAPNEVQQGTLSRFERANDGTNRLRIAFCKQLGFMAKAYARSIAFYGSDLVVALGPNYVHRFQHRLITNETTEVPYKIRYFTRQWKANRGQMNDVTFIDGFWWISQTAECRLFREQKLPVAGKWKEVTIKKRPEFKVETLKNKYGLALCKPQVYGRTDMCVGGGTPYFMTKIGSRIYLPYIFGCSGIYSFESGNSTLPIVNLKHHFHKLGWAETVEDIQKRGKNW